MVSREWLLQVVGGCAVLLVWWVAAWLWLLAAG